MVQLSITVDGDGVTWYLAELVGAKGVWMRSRDGALRSLMRALLEKNEVGLFARTLGVREFHSVGEPGKP